MSKFQFGNVVVIDDDLIGVIVKTWRDVGDGCSYDVYVRIHSTIINKNEGDIKHFVYSKLLHEDEKDYY